jgi:hypothetical protein
VYEDDKELIPRNTVVIVKRAPGNLSSGVTFMPAQPRPEINAYVRFLKPASGVSSLPPA